MRERTPLPRNVIERLPNLKLIASTGSVNASIDVAATSDHGIAVVHTGYRSDPTVELTWALILASVRHVVTESNSVRSGGWQQTVGTDLRGKTLAVLGLGNVGSQVARIGSAFGMKLIAWSQNMTPESATGAGAILVSKDQLFERADILTIHLVPEQPYARPGREHGVGANEANGLVDQCVARADRRGASFDQRVEKQANRRRSDRRIRH